MTLAQKLKCSDASSVAFIPGLCSAPNVGSKRSKSGETCCET